MPRSPWLISPSMCGCRACGPRGRHPVASQAADAKGQRWRGEATFAADGDGVVDLDRSAPVSGSYGGADGMGLFWSMRPATGDPDEAWFVPGTPTRPGRSRSG